MNKTSCIKFGFVLAGVLVFAVGSVRADTFGSGGNTFTIDFVDIRNAGNGPFVIGSISVGAVPYNYRIGTYQISQDQINKAGLPYISAGAWGGSLPAANINWYNAAAFVNWLNTSTGRAAAYQLDTYATTVTQWQPTDAGYNPSNTYRNSNAYYFLPTENEWFKAAYHKNNGVTEDYWL